MRSQRILAVWLAIAVVSLAGCTSATSTSTPSDQSSPSSQTANSPATPSATSNVVGPNATLPAAKAASVSCADLDALLAEAMTSSTSGRAFIEAQATKADIDDPEAVEARDKSVSETWIEFVDDFWQTNKEKLNHVAGEDADAGAALVALERYSATASRLQSGEIVQFADEAEAIRQLEAGEQPEENPEYVTATKAIAEDMVTLSECMPTWPVVF